MKSPDVVIVGAGIVGAACAMRLAEHGLRVHIVESREIAGGATAAGMGHLCVIDDSPAQAAITRLSCAQWRAFAEELPRDAEYSACGTLWVARDDSEMELARSKQSQYHEMGVRARFIDGSSICEIEPELSPRVVAGVRVEDDAVVYAPVATRFMLDRAQYHGATVAKHAVAKQLTHDGLILNDKERLSCAAVVVATGVEAPRLIPGLPVRPRKGQLAITDRGPVMCRHQIVELAYIKNAHGHADESVSFNVQPRPTGQILIGSSRSYHDQTQEIDDRMMRIMLERAVEYLPALADRRVLRMWTGFRAATPDSLPIIGHHPIVKSVLIASGHEGLGLTNSLATAHLICSSLTGTAPEIDPSPYLPERFASSLRELAT